MESHLVRIINRLEMMAADGGNLKRNFEREGGVVPKYHSAMTQKMVQFSHCVTLKLVNLIHLIAST